jgi:hypothetical protein
MPEKRLPLLQTAGHDLRAQIEAMHRGIRHYDEEVQRIRQAFDAGNREEASRLLAEGRVMTCMEELRRQSLSLADTIESIEMFVEEERAARR